jgi:hypothetical protein
VQDVKSVVENDILSNNSQPHSNLGHVAKNLARLFPATVSLWSQLRTGNPLLANSMPSFLYSELYLSGIVKRQDGHLVIRNKIYEHAFLSI